MARQSLGNGGDILEYLAGNLRGWDLKAVILFEGDDKLQGIYRVEAQAPRPEQELVVADFVGGDLKHKVLDHHLFEVVFECC